ncbi:MJ0042-type zinc finger domain-containing protein, partial [Oleiphilus sp. HI0061]
MSNQRLTQCPHCKASFKVSEEQLSAANGRVRCGACMNIFDAIAYS